MIQENLCHNVGVWPGVGMIQENLYHNVGVWPGVGMIRENLCHNVGVWPGVEMSQENLLHSVEYGLERDKPYAAESSEPELRGNSWRFCWVGPARECLHQLRGVRYLIEKRSSR